MLHWATTATPRDYGEFAPLACQAAAAGDALALRLVGGAAAAVATLVRRVEALARQRVAMVGGLGEALRPFLAADVAARVLRAPLFDPTDGAIVLVGGALPRARLLSATARIADKLRREIADGRFARALSAAGRARALSDVRRLARDAAARHRSIG